MVVKYRENFMLSLSEVFCFLLLSLSPSSLLSFRKRTFEAVCWLEPRATVASGASLSHLQEALRPLCALRGVWLEPADGFVAHGTDAADLQPLHQTPERQKERIETERVTEKERELDRRNKKRQGIVDKKD